MTTVAVTTIVLAAVAVITIMMTTEEVADVVQGVMPGVVTVSGVSGRW